uniref:AlNc14C86G5518 protein n=1 Tax=Albugo laibachii Nc14 TaxID=890382 RepID=F0WFY5_9STRA|nr:AlNc14C86G5518 [Albugo laibachii Nc14]|eukprot:CCA20119.1 AlNc14C86G5518 [Albugo laibachii Nc14]
MDACAIVKVELFQSDQLQFQIVLIYFHELNKRVQRADVDFDGTINRRVVVVHTQGIRITPIFSDRGININGTFMNSSPDGTLLVACLRNRNNEIQIVAVVAYRAKRRKFGHLLEMIKRSAFLTLIATMS